MSYFYVFGTDKRTEYIKLMIKEEGRLTEDSSLAKYIVAPTPFTKDNENVFGTDVSINTFINKCKGKIVFAGAIPSFVKEKLDAKEVEYYDLMEYEDVAVLNAIPTAEGAISVAMEMSDITLHGSNVLVLGFGKIGKVLSKMLLGIGANVYCEARNKKDLALIKALGYNSIDLRDLDKYLPKFDYVFNTIPYLILDEIRLARLKKDVYLIDLASKPGGIDFNYAKSNGMNVTHALALPSKVAPKTAALYFKQKIEYIINNI